MTEKKTAEQVEQEILSNIKAIAEGADEVPYLDNGCLKLVGKFGNDELAARAARTSFDNMDKEYSAKRNQGLINTLVEQYHTSPLEVVNITFQMKVPIFVERQQSRHRTARQNQQSFRYDQCEGDFYVPELSRIRGNDAYNKQGSGDELPVHIQEVCQTMMKKELESQFETYNKLINAGVTREVSRGILSVNYYTKILWQMDVKNLFNYLRLRDDGHAQWEIQVLARYMSAFVKREFPMLHGAFEEFWKGGVSFSKTEMELLKSILTKDSLLKASEVESILGSKRRAMDFKKKLGIEGE